MDAPSIRWPVSSDLGSEQEIARTLIEDKLSQLLVDDEAGWEASAREIEAKIYNSEGIEIARYNSPSSFSSALMDQLSYQHDLQGRFACGAESLNDFEVAEELVWVLVPSGFIFGE
jgi:hypothetical protein